MKSEDVISEVREGKYLFQTFKNESINFAAGERISPSPLAAWFAGGRALL